MMLGRGGGGGGERKVNPYVCVCYQVISIATMCVNMHVCRRSTGCAAVSVQQHVKCHSLD